MIDDITQNELANIRLTGTGSVGWERNQLTEFGSISTWNYGMMGAIVLERPAFQPIHGLIAQIPLNGTSAGCPPTGNSRGNGARRT